MTHHHRDVVFSSRLVGAGDEPPACLLGLGLSLENLADFRFGDHFRQPIGAEDHPVAAFQVNLVHLHLDRGGITADRALQITVNGAAGVAVINAIFKADDPESATRAIAAAIGK